MTVQVRPSGVRRILIGGFVVASILLLGVCDVHQVKATQICPALEDRGAARVAQDRADSGAPRRAAIGLRRVTTRPIGWR